MSYEDSTGSYQARVIAAQVDNNVHASFTAEVTSSAGAYAGMPVGTLVPMVVDENGESGVNDNATWLDPNDSNPIRGCDRRAVRMASMAARDRELMTDEELGAVIESLPSE